MKAMTVSEAHQHLPELIQWVAAGEEVELLDQQQRVAKVVPPDWEPTRLDWAETWRLVDAVFGGQPARGKAGSQVVIEGRR